MNGIRRTIPEKSDIENKEKALNGFNEIKMKFYTGEIMEYSGTVVRLGRVYMLEPEKGKGLSERNLRRFGRNVGRLI